MAKLRINGDSSGYVDLEAPNAASSRTIDLDQVPQLDEANVFTTAQTIQNGNAYYAANIAESSHPAIALRITPTRAGQTKGISLGAIGNSGPLSTGIQAYDTSDNSANTLQLNPHGGAVTSPNQPAWFATGNAGWHTSSTGGVIPLAAVPLNRGNHYSTSGSKFTAPISGVYQVNFQAYLDTNQQACMKLNGVDYIPTGGDTSFMLFTNNSAGHETVSASGTIYLAQGDYIQMGARNNQSVVIYTAHSAFSGHLIG